MTQVSEKVIKQIQALRLRDFVMILLLTMLIVPVWLTWRVVEDPTKLAALVELKQGYKIEGSVAGCVLLSAANRTRPSYQLVKELSSSSSDLTIGLYAEKRTAFTNDEAKSICVNFTKSSKKLSDNVNVEYKKIDSK